MQAQLVIILIRALSLFQASVSNYGCEYYIMKLIVIEVLKVEIIQVIGSLSVNERIYG